VTPDGSAPVALITGTSSGIGLATSVALAAVGYRVVATMRDLGRADELVKRASDASVEVDIRQLDVTDPEGARSAVAGVVEDYGSLDLLVNNAGAIQMGSIEQLSMSDLRSVFDTNFFGMVHLTKLVLPVQRQHGGGRILSVSSVGGVIGHPFVDSYCAAKAATEIFLESLAPVAAVFGVVIALIEPGPVATADVQKMEDAVDALKREIDPAYAPIFEPYAQSFVGRYDDAQSADEVAQVIVEVARDPTPRFRYQTSPEATAFVAQKLADIDGAVAMRLGRTALGQPS
jgi:NAD(P)-dependent dehydrogenase (short-subunit alcohol dehydrogenase family)